MAREQRTGMIVSAAGHGAVLLWVLVGGFFSAHDMPPMTMSTEVSLMSSEDFAALQAAAPKATAEAPEAPSMPAAGAETPPEPPRPEPAPEPVPEPVQPEAQPQPEAPPEPQPAPEVTEPAPPDAAAAVTPPEPLTAPVEEPSATMITTEIAKRPKPKPASRVAPVPTEAPPPEAEVADAAEPQQQPDPAATPDQPVTPPTEAAAPPEAGEVLRTEDNSEDVAQSSAPAATARPKPRPAKPAPAREPAAEPAPAETETAAVVPETGSDQAGIDSALAEAMAGEQADEASPGTGAAESGPPMTSGEKDALVIAVKGCWNVGALSTDALHTVVTIGVSMGRDGKPDGGTIRMIGATGGDDTSARQAFEAGRRAIIRCARDGYPLPAEKYAQWREIEIVFDPSQMRMK